MRCAGEGRVGGLDAQVDVAADEFQAAIAEQRAGEQAGFDQDLEAVADAEHEAAIGGELLDGLHDGREFGDGAAAQVVAVGEAAGQDDGVDIAESGGVVPDELRLLPEVVGDGVEGVVIAIAAGKDDDAKFHDECFGEARFYFIRGEWRFAPGPGAGGQGPGGASRPGCDRFAVGRSRRGEGNQGSIRATPGCGA